MDPFLNEKQLRTFLTGVNFPSFNQYYGLEKQDQVEIGIQKLTDSISNGKVFVSGTHEKIAALLSFRALSWDSEHYGYKCGIIDQYYFDASLSPEGCKQYFRELLGKLIVYANQEGFRFISVSIHSWDSFLTEAIQEKGFRYILTWLDGVIKAGTAYDRIFPENRISQVQKEELPYYQDLAYTNYFEGGRFFLDKNFNKLKVREMYSGLVESSYHNGEIMLSYRISDEPAGLFICKKIQLTGRNSFRVAPLRFLVIRNDIRQKNIGKDFFAGTLNYLSDKCDLITTGLEVHNLPSLNLHSSMGFRFNNTHNVFHCWLR